LSKISDDVRHLSPGVIAISQENKKAGLVRHAVPNILVAVSMVCADPDQFYGLDMIKKIITIACRSAALK
jgi:hypothetical protein